ncbi:MAG TPA: AMP-binding protein [Streptosporangiaceae bacterium]|nr:AMP-binding protein [Streptosporangiaceae bacterium]
MERVSTGERTAADQLMVSDCSPDRALTERILDVADEAGYGAALIDATDGSVTAWPWFARTVRAAAAGLARRGLAEGDTAGVFVQDAASAAIAVNAIRAAGGRACLIRSDAGPADVADRLNACAARVLITSAPLAGLAAEGADRSRVRQVIAFGDADGTTPFSSLLGSGRHSAPGWQPDGQAAAGPGFADRSGPAHEFGRPEGNGQTHARDLTDSGEPGSGGDLTHRDVVVAGPPCGDGPAYTSLLDLTLLAGATLVAAPVPLVAPALRVYKGTAAIVPPGTRVPGLELTRIFAAG